MFKGDDKDQADNGIRGQARLPIFGSEPERTKGPDVTNEREEKKENPSHMLTNVYNFLFKDRAAAWTAIFTFVLAIFSYLLWQVSNDANQLAVATQAASVSSMGPSIVKTAGVDGKALKGYNIIFSWVNSGNTPTRTAEMQSNVYIGTASPGKGLDFSQLPQDRIVTAVIAPKFAIQTAPVFVTLQDVEDVQQGKKHMFFWGWAVYHDSFSPAPRLSEYCFDVEGATWTKSDHADFTGETQFINTPCSAHFCFNDECEDYKARTK